MKDRRTKEGYKLRVYIDEIKHVKAMTKEEWVAQWLSCPTSEVYLSQDVWISYLERCAMIEAEKIALGEAV